MIRWQLETCFCIIITERPSVKGTFEQRCRLHANARDTLVVTQHNIDNKAKQFESNPDPKNRPPTKADETRRADLKESTRP